MESKCKPTCSSIPKFSSYHPVIPQSYTPAWKLDMNNRDIIVENAKMGNLPYDGTETTLYLENRERLSRSEPKESVMNKSMDIPRDRLLRPWFHSPISKYQSTLMFRSTDK